MKEIENILVIGDLHMPFTKPGYLEHCLAAKKEYKTNKTIFIGDLIDNHFTSYYEINPDGYSAGGELAASVRELKEWKKAFKEAFVTIGNHDRLVLRKAFSNGISSKWIKGMAEVLETPNWKYDISYESNKVLYYHGEGGSNMLQTIYRHRQSIVMGHWHTKFEITFSTSEKDILWGMNVGCGIDIKRYAFEYMKHNTKRPILGCGAVLDNGRLPILVPMNLK